MSSPSLPPRSPSAPPPVPPPVMLRSGSAKRKNTTVQQEISGCEVPFVPAGGGTSFTRFKQLSTRRKEGSTGTGTQKQRTVSSPSLGAAFSEEKETSSQDETWGSTASTMTAIPVTQSGPQTTAPSSLPLSTHPKEVVSVSGQQRGSKDLAFNNNGSSLGFTVNPGIQPTGDGTKPSAFMGYLDASQWTVLDDGSRDHPGMRKTSGFLQPIRHLSGKILK